MRLSTNIRVRATKLRFRAFHFSHAVVLVLCYCIAIQPNAALAARSSQLIAAAPSEKSATSAKKPNRSKSPTLLIGSVARWRGRAGAVAITIAVADDHRCRGVAS